MYQYKVFIKDGLDLTGLPIANETCVSFNIEVDLLSTATSSFVLLNMPSNIKEGDVLGLVSPYGEIIYTGVINAIELEEITCRPILSIFNDEWKWHNPTQTTIEGKLVSIVNGDFINSSDPMISDRFPFTCTASSSTTGDFESQDDTFVIDFETMLMNMYSSYGIITDISVPFGETTPTIVFKKSTHSSVKIGNNVLSIQNMTPLTEVFETNKLVIYDNEGNNLRGTYYATKNGITTNANDPLRLPVTKTKYVFNTDDSLDDIKNENLQEEIYNHRITFDLLLDNGLYDFADWELGMPVEIWYNGEYYSTVFTRYAMSKEEGEDVAFVSVTCGKVRNTLTQKINAKEEEDNEKFLTAGEVNSVISTAMGDCVVTTTNVNPSSALGGTWELIDKEFTPSTSTRYEAVVTLDNASSATVYVSRNGHILALEYAVTTNVELGDTAVTLVTLDYSSVGVSRIAHSEYCLLESDGGNGIVMASLGVTNGALNSYDVVTKTSGGTIASGSTLNGIIHCPVHYTQMLDSFCNKFYWRRVS